MHRQKLDVAQSTTVQSFHVLRLAPQSQRQYYGIDCKKLARGMQLACERLAEPEASYASLQTCKMLAKGLPFFKLNVKTKIPTREF